MWIRIVDVPSHTVVSRHLLSSENGTNDTPNTQIMHTCICDAKWFVFAAVLHEPMVRVFLFTLRMDYKSGKWTGGQMCELMRKSAQMWARIQLFCNSFLSLRINLIKLSFVFRKAAAGISRQNPHRIVSVLSLLGRLRSASQHSTLIIRI